MKRFLIAIAIFVLLVIFIVGCYFVIHLLPNWAQFIFVGFGCLYIIKLIYDEIKGE